MNSAFAPLKTNIRNEKMLQHQLSCPDTQRNNKIGTRIVCGIQGLSLALPPSFDCIVRVEGTNGGRVGGRRRNVPGYVAGGNSLKDRHRSQMSIFTPNQGQR